MSVLTPTQQALVNTHPQRTQLYLSVYEPAIGFVCTVTGSYDATNQMIDYMDASGSLSNIVNGLYQVALVGTAPNDDSKGRTWVRYSTGTSQLRFVESDHIDWANGDVVTVLNFTEIIPLFPRIIQNPLDETDVIFYKVWDISYTDQNTIIGSFVDMGCHYAGFKDDNGQYRVYWTASGTSNLIGDGLTYVWDFGNSSTPTGSTSHTPGWVVYPTGGHYRNILRVTSDSGREDIAVRFVSLYDRPGQGSNLPLLNWEFSEPPSGSRDSTGYSWRIKLRESSPKTKIRDGSLVVIFADDWYGGTRQSLGGSSEHKETVKFVGWIKDGSIQTNYADHSIEFECHSPTGVMEYSECFSCSVESKVSPAYWYELQDMNLQKAIYHYLAWHSTVLQVCDVRSNFVDQYIQYFDADRTSLYDAINTLISGARRGRILSDRQGMIWLEQEAEAIVSGSSVFPTALELSKYDWIGDPVIDEVQTDETAFIEMGGIAFYPNSGSAGGFNALLCDAPGKGPRYKGKVERIQGLALANQAELNDMAGQMLAYFNARYPNAEYKLRGNFANVDIAPQEQFKVTMGATENNRGLTWNKKGFSIRGITWNWDAKAEVLYPQTSLHELVNGFPAETIVIPDVPPTDGDGGDFEQPDINVPPLPEATGIATGTSTYIQHDDFLYITCPLATYNDDDDWVDVLSATNRCVKFTQEKIDQGLMWADTNPGKVFCSDLGEYSFKFRVGASFGSAAAGADLVEITATVKLYSGTNVLLDSFSSTISQVAGYDGDTNTCMVEGWFAKLIGTVTFTSVSYIKVNIVAYNWSQLTTDNITIYNSELQMYRMTPEILTMKA